MAKIRVASGGNDANAGTNWTTDALATKGQALTNWSSGDEILIEYNADVGGQTSSLTLTGGAVSTPIPIYTSNTSDVYTRATVANPNIAITDTGADLTYNISCNVKGEAITIADRLYLYNSSNSVTLDEVSIEFTGDKCEVFLGSTNADLAVKFLNVDITESTSSSLQVIPYSNFIWEGGTLTVNTYSTGLFVGYSARSMVITIKEVDFGGSTFGGVIVDASEAGDAMFHYKFVSCEFPASMPTVHDSGFGNDGQVIELINSGPSSSNIDDYQKYTYRGSLETITTEYRSSGNLTYCHSITPTSVFKDGARFEGPWMVINNSTTGSSQTVTVYSADDFTSAPNANQMFIEVVSMDTSGEVLGILATSRPSDKLATTAMGSDSSTWNGTPTHTHKMSASFTAQVAGDIAVRVVLEGFDLSGETANACYYDPELTVA